MSAGVETALAAEHAAVYLYAALGGRASRLEDDRLEETLSVGYQAHVTLRDQLVGLVGGAEVVPPEPAYELPAGIGSARGIRAAALRIEERCTAALLAATGEVADQDRRLLIEALGDAAVRQLGVGGDPTAFPGSS